MSHLKLIRTNSDNQDFKALVVLLDDFLSIIDGDEHAFYAQYNKIDAIKEVIVAYKNSIPVGCGAIKRFNEHAAEVKRMFVHTDYRNQGIAAEILGALETWATELAFSNCILETGIRQQPAVALYKKLGYQIIANYGQYEGVENSVCMIKSLKKS